MMVKTTYRAAKSEYGERLRVASLGALEQHKGDFRVIHDGTHGVRVNPAIRVRDKEACPMAHDLVAALDYEICSGTNGLSFLPWTSRRPTAACRSPRPIGGSRPAQTCRSASSPAQRRLYG